MAIGNIVSGTLGEFNVGLAGAVGFLVPLGIQIDALIAAGIGPFEFDLSARLNALLAAQAGLAISIGNPFLSLQILLSAIANLVVALQGALALGLPSISIGLQLSAVAALSGSLAITLGGLQIAIRLALAVKIPALNLAAELAAALKAGPAFAFTYDGTLSTVGSEIAALYNTGLTHGSNVINPWDTVYGLTILTTLPSVQAALGLIITVG